jgi:hypothetical protein
VIARDARASSRRQTIVHSEAETSIGAKRKDGIS